MNPVTAHSFMLTSWETSLAITLTPIRTEISHELYMNPGMACFSLLTSSETICGDVISSCIINKTNETLYS